MQRLCLVGPTRACRARRTVGTNNGPHASAACEPAKPPTTGERRRRKPLLTLTLLQVLLDLAQRHAAAMRRIDFVEVFGDIPEPVGLSLRLCDRGTVIEHRIR